MSLQGYYKNVAGVTGGGGVRNYSQSPVSGANEKLVRGIASALKNDLKVSGVNPNASSLGEVCDSILKNLPVKRNGKGIKADAKAHKELARKLANAINDVYGSQVLNANMDPEVLPDQIVELLESLCAGLNGEYAAVSGEVKRVAKNLMQLRILLDRSHANLMNKINASDDEGLKAESVMVTRVHQLLVDEVNRQHAILQNLMKTVIDVSDQNLAHILEENGEIRRGIVKRIEGGPGSQKYSHALMAALDGAGNVALMTYEVDKALKKIGMTVADYTNSKSVRDLEAEAGKILDKKLQESHPDLVELGEFMRAIETLRSFDYKKDEIAKSLKSGADEEYEGGRPESVSKRIKNRRKLRDAMFRVHNAEMAQVFDSMVHSMQALGRNLGTEIIATEALDKVVGAITALPDMSKKGIYMSLTGYLDHATARQRREYFVNQLNYAMHTLDKVIKMDVYAKFVKVFQQLKDDLQKVVALVERFQDHFKTSWKIAAPIKGADEDGPSAEDGASLADEAHAAYADADAPGETERNEITGMGMEGGAYEPLPIPEITKSAYAFKEAMDDLRYFYNMSKARYNLAKVAVESRENAEDYHQILGEGIGKKLVGLTEVYNKENEALKGVTTISEELKTDLQSFRDDVYKAKTDLYRTAEAIEVYLQAFSDAITTHPDEVKSLKMMLDEVDLAAKFFTNKSGDNICEVFDCFPDSANNTDHKRVDGHYYESVVKWAGAGNPSTPLSVSDVQKVTEGAKAKADKAVRSLAILKNLVSAFFSIGEKFGDAEIRKRTHMTTAQIFQNLNRYLWISAFCQADRHRVYDSNVIMNDIKSAEFAETDNLFVMLCKCLVAKPLTVTGVYNMLNRPSYKQKVMHPIRAVLGGSDDYPKIDSKLMALYVRLPLLAEFYRGVFEFDKLYDGTNPSPSVSMLPEIDGLFSGLIEIVFDRSSYVSNGAYSDTVIKQIVEEVNRIYSKVEARKDSITTDIINEFIAEMNRRYGMLARSEAKEFIKERDEYERDLKNLQGVDLNYPILPGEDDPDVRMPAPSDAYNSTAVKAYKSKVDLKLDEKCIINKLRGAIDKKFYEAESDTNESDFSFNQAIYQAQVDLSKTEDAKARFRVVSDAVQGSGKFLRHGGIKILMFGETVVSTLNLLSSIRDILSKYRDEVDSLERGSSFGRNEMDIIIEILFGQGCDLNKLVEIKIVDGRLMVDHSSLKNVVEKAFSHVKEMMNKFRGDVPTDIIEKYERSTDKGSLFELEENLFDDLIRGKRSNGKENNGIDRVNQRLSDLVDKINKTGATLFTCIKKAAFYSDINDFVRGGRESDPHTVATAFASILDASVSSMIRRPKLPIKMSDDRAQNLLLYSIQSTTHWNAYENGIAVSERSLWALFNETVHRYLNTIYDNSTGRAYAKALASFAAGPMSSYVNNPNSGFPSTDFGTPGELAAKIAAAENNGILNSNKILISGNAHIMNQLMNSTIVSTGKPAYLVQELADVPDHVKDRFRANLPAYAKQLDTLIAKAELLKNLMELDGFNLANGALSSKDAKLAFNTTIDALIQACFSLRTTIMNVLRELDDQPKYLEVAENSIESYRAMYNNLPIMPLSSMNALLRNVNEGVSNIAANGPAPVLNYTDRDAWDQNVMLPYGSSGSSGFKLRYGTRFVLNRPETNVTIDHMPWVKELFEAYNGVSDSRTELNATKFGEYLQSHVELLRYVVDARHVRGKLSRSGTNNPVLANVSSLDDKRVFSLKADNKLDVVLAMTETSARDRARSALITAITGTTMALNRDNILVRNLIDLNVMPINVRALMREVVLVNVYNYAYTWDHMVADMFGYHPSSELVDDCNGKTFDYKKLVNPRDTFVRLLVCPYQELDYVAYYGLYSQIMAGNSGTQLGRPKFISDQVYNKALLGELYSINQMTYNNLLQPATAKMSAGRNMNLPQGPSPRDAVVPGLFGNNTNVRNARGETDYTNMVTDNGNKLTYMVDGITNDKRSGAAVPDRVKEVTVTNKLVVKQLGLIRFNTKFARNIIFLAQLQRVLRLKLSQELSWNKRVSDGVVLLDPRFTEIDGDKNSYDKNEGRLAGKFEY